MAVLLFNTWPLAGPAQSMVHLAKALSERGHQIHFLGIADCEPIVQRAGFAFHRIHQDYFPKGVIADSERKRKACKSLSDIVTLIREQKDRFKRFYTLESLTGFEAILQQVKPDLFLIEASTETSCYWGLIGHKFGLPSLYVNTILPFRNEGNRPPLDSDIIPRDTALSRLAVKFAWWRFYIARRAKRLLFDANWDACVSSLARAVNYPVAKVSFDAFACPLTAHDEINTTPTFLDFKTGAGTALAKNYLEPYSIDEANDFYKELAQIKAERSIIYCSLGSHYISSEQKIALFNKVISAAEQQLDWYLIIGLGKGLTADDLKPCGENIKLFDFAPQKEILAHADMMITHGGINTIKECIFFKVPMLVFPFKFDQVGNAARVDYHGIGCRADYKTATTSGIYEQINSILANQAVEQKIAVMQQAYQSSSADCLDWIENQIVQKSEERT